MKTLPIDMEIYLTGDGSPTLSFKRADGYVEKMHHAGGAISERFYLYHEALLQLLSYSWRPEILSMGLGLGYNELISIGQLGISGVEDFKLWSFESRADLRDEFVSWLENPQATPLTEIYHKVLSLIATKLTLSPEQLFTWAKQAYRARRFEILGSFPEQLRPETKVNLVFYDAYSNKMDPELWTEDGLVNSLRSALNCRAIFTTYAATGALNRALKELGFRLCHKPGFSGKRESTLAIREIIG